MTRHFAGKIAAAAALFAALAFPAGVQSDARAGALPSQIVSITKAEDKPGVKLSMDAVISAPVGQAELGALSQKVYSEADGADYDSVFLMWYLPHYKIGAGAWGSAAWNGRDSIPEVKILALQDFAPEPDLGAKVTSVTVTEENGHRVLLMKCSIAEAADEEDLLLISDELYTRTAKEKGGRFTEGRIDWYAEGGSAPFARASWQGYGLPDIEILGPVE